MARGHYLLKNPKMWVSGEGEKWKEGGGVGGAFCSVQTMA